MDRGGEAIASQSSVVGDCLDPGVPFVMLSEAKHLGFHRGGREHHAEILRFAQNDNCCLETVTVL